ncbi:hypothetical protein [Massilia glaciei]|uniref:DUF4407 domain-containing protein n=1 Tax=Massilia glaciei TaxID=1524097 RepID=A0A2U2I7L1_9BURK|nr:hypothetical protein [Massilia glaciei]PWF55732.1 hypothetical protein C7C56_000335 [Massilia glaciei]
MNPHANQPFAEPTPGDRTAQSVLIGVIALFVVVLTLGWSKLIGAWFSPGLSFAAWLVALGMALVAVVLAKGVALEKIRLRLMAVGAAARADFTWVAYFAALFVISALGTMNTAFYFGEGKQVLTEAIDHANEDLASLQASAPKLLSDPQLEQKKASINRLLSNLEAEISSANGGNNCGVAASSREIIRELAVVLPGFRQLSGSTGFTCAGNEARFKALALSYRNQAYQLLRNHPDYVAVNGERKERLQATVRERVTQENQRLMAAKAQLDGAADGAAKPGGAYGEAKNALEAASTTYSQLLVELEQVSGARTSLPRAIAVDQARQLGSIAQIVPSMVGRLDRLTTWFYFLIAISADVILIMCFMRVFGAGRREGGARQNGREHVQTKTDLNFLWVNP